MLRWFSLTTCSTCWRDTVSFALQLFFPFGQPIILRILCSILGKTVSLAHFQMCIRDSYNAAWYPYSLCCFTIYMKPVPGIMYGIHLFFAVASLYLLNYKNIFLIKSITVPAQEQFSSSPLSHLMFTLCSELCWPNVNQKKK